MSQVTTTKPETGLGRIEQVLIGGDLSRLTELERVTYYKTVCETVGLNPLTQPFDYMTLNGKLVLYAKKACTDQLRSVRKVSVKITSRETIEGVYVVAAQAKLLDGREDESTGAVTIQGLKGDNLANAMMKAETKAKRRVTLSICGLGMLDESEVETIPPQNRVAPQQPEVGDGIDPPDKGYVIDFGQWNKKTLEQVYRDLGPKEMAKYVIYLEDLADKAGKPLGGKALVFTKNCTEFLAAMENNSELDVDPTRGG